MTTPGIYKMTAETYHADCCDRPSLSASIIHLLCSQSPRHAYTAHPRLNPAYVREEAERMDIGTIAHSIILEGVDVAQVIEYPDWRTNAAKDERQKARDAGKVPILRKYWDDVLAMVAAARIQLDQHREGKRAFKNGKPEVTLVWEEDGILCRARLDWLMNDYSVIWDYKSTGASANPEVVSRTLFGGGNDIQAAWYLRGLKAVTGKEAQFRFVYQETFPPYALSVIGLGPDALFLAEKKIIYGLDLFRKCLDSGVWPGYPTDTAFAKLPAWEEARWIEREEMAS